MVPQQNFFLEAVQKDRSSGFTVVELVVSIAILSVLFLLVSQNLGSYRDRTNLIQCFASIRGLGNALQLYATENDQRLPALTENNVEIGGGGGFGTVDIRFELYVYDSKLWNIVCPADPLKKNDPNPQNPTYISYKYVPYAGLDLGKVDAPTPIVQDGAFHGKPTRWKATKLFSDNHVELQ